MDKLANSTVSKSLPPAAFERNLFKVAAGGGITFASKFFLSILRFVTAVLLARLLGAEQYGFYNLALSAASVATGISLFGLDSALVRYIAITAGRRDQTGVWGVFQIGVGFAMLLSVGTSTALFALAYPIAGRLFHEPRLVPLLQVVSLVVPLLALSEVLAGAMRGFKKMQYSALAQFIVQPVVRLILIVALALIRLDARSALIVYGLSDLTASAILLYYLNKLLPLKRPFHFSIQHLRSILVFSLPVWISELMLNFRSNVQALFIGSLNTIAGVGVFSVAEQLNLVGSLFSSSINVSAKPFIAELHDQGDLKQMEHIYQNANKWALMVQLPFFLVMVLFPVQILSIFGESFTAGAPALVILAFLNLIQVGTGMGGIILDMAGYTKLKLMNSTLRLILFLVLDIWLIPPWGLMGAAMAALAGEGLINLLRLLEVFILFRLLPYNRSFVKPFIASGAALGGVLLVGIWLPLDVNLLSTVFHASTLFAIYAGATLLLGLSMEDRALLARVRQRIQARVTRN